MHASDDGGDDVGVAYHSCRPAIFSHAMTSLMDMVRFPEFSWVCFRHSHSAPPMV